MRGFVNRHITGEINGTPLAKAYAFGFVLLADIHFQPRSIGDMKPSGDTRTLQAMVGIAFLILFVACSNFVSMMTARAVKPLAGRLLAPDHGEDDLLRADANSASNPSIVINESGARALGFGSPQAAVNQFGRWVRVTQSGDALKLSPSLRSQIVGVIPDFSVGSVRDVIEPTAYYIDPSMTYFVVLKLDGHVIPQTMRAVRALWKQHEPTQSFDGMFLSQYVNDLYADIQRQSTIFSAFAAVALVVAALGLLGLAVFTAERQTREIGLRKVMGASRWDILRLLGWQFTRPVLWANLLAWPLTYLFMQRWLEGFARSDIVAIP
jgi:putative ABC transport system permease protein